MIIEDGEEAIPDRSLRSEDVQRLREDLLRVPSGEAKTSRLAQSLQKHEHNSLFTVSRHYNPMGGFMPLDFDTIALLNQGVRVDVYFTPEGAKHALKHHATSHPHLEFYLKEIRVESLLGDNDAPPRVGGLYQLVDSLLFELPAGRPY